MPRGSIHISIVKNPREVFQFTMMNAYWIGCALGIYVWATTGLYQGALCFLCGFVSYIGVVHRKIFLLKEAPPRHGFLTGGWIGDRDSFWEFVQESGLSEAKLEASFWNEVLWFLGGLGLCGIPVAVAAFLR